MPRLRTQGLAALLVLATVAASCGPIDQLLGKATPTPTPSGITPTPSGTGTATPTPLPTPVQSTQGEITTFDWGTVALPAGASPDFTFTAPANTIDVQFQAIGSAADAASYFLFFSVTGPSGTAIDNTAGGPEKQAPNTGLAAFALPASDSAVSVVGPGTYTFHVAAFSPTNPNPPVASHPHVLAKVRTRAGGLANNNILDLNIVGVAGADPSWVDLATMKADVRLTTAMNEMAAAYASIGVQISTPNEFFLNDSSFATISSETQLEQLFQKSLQVKGNNAHTIFLVSDLSGLGGGGGTVVGIAGGIPIPHDNNGTLHSGVAVSVSAFPTGTGMGNDIAHETGHALGLFHTSEYQGSAFDPISDTPTCDSTTQSANINACPDKNNVMFWELLSSAPTFSAGQGKVVRPAISLHSGASFAPAPLTASVAIAHGARVTPTGMVLYCKVRAIDVTKLGIPEGGLRTID